MNVTDHSDRRAAYVREILRLYRVAPGVLGHVRRADRELAARLYDRGVPLFVVENALLIAAARRVLNNAFATPLPPIRSLHYFITTIDEVRTRPPGYRDLEELRARLRAALQA